MRASLPVHIAGSLSNPALRFCLLLGVILNGFTVTNAQQAIQVLNPADGDLFQTGSSIDIRWSTSEPADLVGLVLYRDGIFEDTLAERYSNSGQFSWQPAGDVTEGTGYQVEVFEVLYFDKPVACGDEQGRIGTCYERMYFPGNASARSGTFSLISPQSAPSLMILSPRHAESFRAGDMIRIVFTGTDFPADIRFAGEEKSYIIQQGVHPGGSMPFEISWKIPSFVEDDQYQVVMSGTESRAVSGYVGVGKLARERIALFEEYDARGNILSAVDANGGKVRYFYGTETAPLSQQGEGVFLTGVQRELGMPAPVPDGSRPKTGESDDLFAEAYYNEKGQLVRLLDENGRDTRYAYDELNRLSMVMAPGGDTLESYQYHFTTSPTGEYDATSPNYIETTAYIGNGEKRISRAYVDGLGRSVQTVTLDGDSMLVAGIEYNERGSEYRVWKSYRIAGGDEREISYRPGFREEARSYYGEETPFTETIYEASPLNRPLHLIPPGGEASAGSIASRYDVIRVGGQWLQQSSVTDEIGLVSHSFTDGWGRNVLSVASAGTPDSAVTGFLYDEMDRLVGVRHPNYFDRVNYPGEWTTRYHYDAKGQLTAKSTVDAGTTRYAYDRAGNLRFRQDARQDSLAELWFGGYDELGRMKYEGISLLEGGQAFTAYGDSTNVTTSIELDKRNWIRTEKWDRPPNSSDYPWSLFADKLDFHELQNTRGRLVASAFKTDPSVVNHLSLEGELIQSSQSLTAADSISARNIIVAAPKGDLRLISGRKITLRPYTRIEEGARFSARIDPKLARDGNESPSLLSEATTSTYNPDDGATWRLTLFSYDIRGRVTDKWIYTRYDPEISTHISYRYNNADELIEKRVVTGENGQHRLTHWMDYDQRGNLISVYVSTGALKPAEPVITYEYTAEGRIREKKLGPVVQQVAYNLRGWATELRYKAIQAPFTAEYRYFKNGNIRESTIMNAIPQTDPGDRQYTYRYAYDYLNRLREADFSKINGNVEAYDINNLRYDRQGNILSIDRNDETGTPIDQLRYSYQGSNRLQALRDGYGSSPVDWDAEPAAFYYDPNGNMTGRVVNGSDSLSFTYDHRNLPLSAVSADGESLRFRYTGDGQRYSRKSEAESYSYILDGPQTLAVFKNDTLAWWNVVGNGIEGRLEAFSGTMRYYLTDHLGSTRSTVDENGNILEAFDYYPFGLLMPRRSTVTGNTMEKYTGKERDEQLGLDYFGARYYDPAIGRWTTHDPLADEPSQIDKSPYAYSWNDPINITDPDGRCPKCEDEVYLPIANHVYDAKMGDITENGWEVIRLDNKEDSGFKGALYKGIHNGNTEYIYGTAGTEDFTDAVEDIMQLVGNSTQYFQSVEISEQIVKNYLGVSFTGHSLGGGLASANALRTSGKAVTFNAAGIANATKNSLALSDKVANITAYIVKGEAVDYYQSIIGIKAEGNVITLPASYFPNVPFNKVDNAYRTYQRMKNHLMSAVISKFNKYQRIP